MDHTISSVKDLDEIKIKNIANNSPSGKKGYYRVTVHLGT